MIKLSKIIAKPFWDVHNLIKQKEYNEFWEIGGRGSTKSSFVSIELIFNLIKNPNMHAVVMRKYANTLRDSVYNQIIWAIDTLGLKGYFACKVSPLMITYIPTGQHVYFRGVDDAQKIKSIRPEFGYTGLIWFEELDEFSGMPEIRKINQSLIRGGEDFISFYSYNPPLSVNNWVNIECKSNKSNRHVHKTNYTQVPADWLGEIFIQDAEYLKKTNELAYRHEYLGEAVGSGGNVFTNIVTEAITNEQINQFDKIKQGIDWGFAVDPFAYIKMHFDKTRRTLYIFDEIYKVGLLNDDAMDLVDKKYCNSSYIIADSAEPKSIAEFKRSRFRIKGAKKGADSVQYGIKFLQRLNKIIIDPARCPNAYKEFINYEFERLKDGSFKNSYPDKNNHIIDATRYALEDDMSNRISILSVI